MASGKTFQLKIIASDKKFYSGPCEQIKLPCVDGSFGILPDHEPLCIAVDSGAVEFTVEGDVKVAAVGVGFAEIMPEFVTVLVDFAEWPEEIDVKRAEEAKLRAEERLRMQKSQKEFVQSQAAVTRAMARLKVSAKKMK